MDAHRFRSHCDYRSPRSRLNPLIYFWAQHPPNSTHYALCIIVHSIPKCLRGDGIYDNDRRTCHPVTALLAPMTFTTFPVFQRARSLFLRFQTLRITSGDVAPQPLRDRVCGCSRNRRIADAFVDAPWCSEGNLHTTNDLGNLVVDVRHSIIYGKYPFCNSMRRPQIFRNDHLSYSRASFCVSLSSFFSPAAPANQHLPILNIVQSQERHTHENFSDSASVALFLGCNSKDGEN